MRAALALLFTDVTLRLPNVALAAAACICASLSLSAQTLVPTNSFWRYLDNGSDQGTEWSSYFFDDSGWAEGQAELGYGDAVDGRPEATVVSYRNEPTNKYITTYFRHWFFVS